VEGCGLWIGNSAEITGAGDVNGHGGNGTVRVQSITDEAIFLVLSSFSYSGEGHGEKDSDGNGHYGAIYYKGNKKLVISFSGTCSLERMGGSPIHDYGKCTNSYGIYSESEQPVIISGGSNPNFTVTCDPVGDNGSGAGIYSNGDLKTERTQPNYQANIKITGPFNVNGDYSYGITAKGNVTVGNSVLLKSTAGEAKTTSIGVNCGGTLYVDNGILTAQGSDASKSVGIIAGGDHVDFSGGTITAIQKDNASGAVVTPAKMSSMVRGTGYKTESDTDGKSFFANAETLLPLEYSEDSTTKYYYKVELEKFDHNHNFSYFADGATITAICNTDNCPLPNHKATLTINAPVKKNYQDGKEAKATITDENGIQNSATISYYKANDAGTEKVGEALTEAPETPGTYWAEITLGKGDDSATAHVVYTIAKIKADELTTDDAKENIKIDYVTETVEPHSEYEVSSSDEKYKEVTSITDILDDSDSPEIFVRKKETEDIAPSNWVAVAL
ncbi:MAG: hypothetical protein IJ672_00170, partial [Methanobrevibacter sp.]|nr:hypothetical protein [Methanobrevibacter sp.]